MSNVWDRTTEVLRARGGVLGGIAIVALYLPGLVRDAVPLVATPGSMTFAMASGAVVLVVGLIALWGQLALLAVATDPGTTRRDAMAQATARLPASLAVTVIAVLAVMLLTLPLGIAFALSGADLSAMRTGTLPDIGGGTVTFLLLYLLAVLIVGIAVAARMLLLNAVVLNERVGLGAFRRSWRLTRGLTWRIVGVLILYGIVVGVAALAAQSVIGAIFGLLASDASLVAFLAAAVSGVVTTILSVVAAVFTAQLYVAVTQRGVASVFA